MFSETLRQALEQDVVGQEHAIQGVVRGVTRLMSGLTPAERSWCAYLFIGPPGTGRTHLVRSLARLLHGTDQVHTVHCNPAGQADPWLWFAQQLAPLFARQELIPRAELRPPNIVLVKDLECAQKELFPILARVLETGQLALPNGRSGSLRNCLVFMTSGLCTAEILDTARIGFSAGSPRQEYDDEQDSIFKMCRQEAENVLGLELLAQLDHQIVFRRLEEEHLASVLDGHFARMNRWLAMRGVVCEMRPEARSFLLECGSHRRLLGARDLIVAHRRELEFPLADLLLSHRLDGGVRVIVDREEDEPHLHFTVQASEGSLQEVASTSGMLEIAVG